MPAQLVAHLHGALAKLGLHSTKPALSLKHGCRRRRRRRRPGLLTLPLPLLRRILAHLLCSARAVVPRRGGRTPGVHGAVLRACRRLHAEGRVLLYGLNRFDFRGGWFDMQAALPLAEFRIAVGAGNARLVRAAVVGMRARTRVDELGEALPLRVVCCSFENLRELTVWFVGDGPPECALQRAKGDVCDFRLPETLAVLEYERGDAAELAVANTLLANGFVLSHRLRTLRDLDLRDNEWEICSRDGIVVKLPRTSGSGASDNSIVPGYERATGRIGNGNRWFLVNVGGGKRVVRENLLAQRLQHRGVSVYKLVGGQE